MSGLSPRNWGRSRRKFSGENAPVFCLFPAIGPRLAAAPSPLHPNYPQQIRRPHRKLRAAAIELLRGLIVAKQQLPGIEHAVDKNFPPEALLHDDGHLVAHRVPSTLRIAKER